MLHSCWGRSSSGGGAGAALREPRFGATAAITPSSFPGLPVVPDNKLNRNTVLQTVQKPKAQHRGVKKLIIRQVKTKAKGQMIANPIGSI